MNWKRKIIPSRNWKSSFFLSLINTILFYKCNIMGFIKINAKKSYKSGDEWIGTEFCSWTRRWTQGWMYAVLSSYTEWIWLSPIKRLRKFKSGTKMLKRRCIFLESAVRGNHRHPKGASSSLIPHSKLFLSLGIWRCMIESIAARTESFWSVSKLVSFPRSFYFEVHWTNDERAIPQYGKSNRRLFMT